MENQGKELSNATDALDLTISQMPVRGHKSVATARLKDIPGAPVNSRKYSHQAVLTAKEATKHGH
jgi:hypothetical protein